MGLRGRAQGAQKPALDRALLILTSVLGGEGLDGLLLLPETQRSNAMFSERMCLDSNALSQGSIFPTDAGGGIPMIH